MDASSIISILSCQTADNHAVSTLESLINSCSPISSSSVPDIAKQFKADNYRSSAINIFKGKIFLLEVVDFIKVGALFKEDNYRTSATEYLEHKLDIITGPSLVDISKLYKGDNYRNSCFLIIQNKIGKISDNDVSRILSVYKGDNYKVSCLEILAPKILNLTGMGMVSILSQISALNYKSSASNILSKFITQSPPQTSSTYTTTINNNSNSTTSCSDKCGTSALIHPITFLEALKNLDDNIKLQQLTNNIKVLDLECEDASYEKIAKFFSSPETLKNACEILGLNDGLISKIEESKIIPQSDTVVIQNGYYNGIAIDFSRKSEIRTSWGVVTLFNRSLSLLTDNASIRGVSFAPDSVIKADEHDLTITGKYGSSSMSY